MLLIWNKFFDWKMYLLLRRKVVQIKTGIDHSNKKMITDITIGRKICTTHFRLIYLKMDKFALQYYINGRKLVKKKTCSSPQNSCQCNFFWRRFRFWQRRFHIKWRRLHFWRQRFRFLGGGLRFFGCRLNFFWSLFWFKWR